MPAIMANRQQPSAQRAMLACMILLPHIKLATPAHAARIAEMSREHIEFGLGWTWTQSRVLRAVQNEDTNVAVTHDRGALTGFGIMRYGERKGHLVLLCVAPESRQRGVGAALVAWLEKSAVTAGLEQVLVEARADNPVAIRFYAEQGYRQTGMVPGYYRGTVDAVRLQKPLRDASVNETSDDE
jgi:ribosomal-protein-alanine N-acetyltransferase